MGKVVSSCRRAVLGWLLMLAPLPNHTHAEAPPQITRPLAATVTVIRPCKLIIADTIAEKSLPYHASEMVRVLCHKATAWKAGFQKSAGERLKMFDRAPPGSGRAYQLIVNF